MSQHHYPAKLIMRARALRAAGWTLQEIARHVKAETGHEPNKTTVHRWVNPHLEDRYRESSARWYRQQRAAGGAATGGRLGCVHHSAAYQDARARALVDKAGMRTTQVALAMAFDYPGQGWDQTRVRRVTREAVAA